MMKYTYLNNFPVYHLDHSTYYQIHGYAIQKFENSREVSDWQKNPTDFEKKIFEWGGNFWKDLQEALQFEIDADQWLSNYYSYMDGRVFHWSDDRHENCYVLMGVQEQEKFLTDLSVPEGARNWIKQLLKK